MRSLLGLFVVCGLFVCSCQTSLSFCDNLIEETCNKIFACNTSGVSKYETKENCLRQKKLETDCEQFGCKGGYVFDGFQADRCLQDFQKMTCKDLESIPLPATCKTLCRVSSR